MSYACNDRVFIYIGTITILIRAVYFVPDSMDYEWRSEASSEPGECDKSFLLSRLVPLLR